jgi:hypothetical protein
VQRTIDRIIFLRMAEDRKIEPYGRLLDLTRQPGIYPHLVHLYRQADAKYNAGLFNLNPSADGDGLTPTMQLDDTVLKPILTSLYYPHSPYEFSVLGADILGNVYEQFLGKVIRLTSGHRAKVEEKPEVKKAGGVFYTPTYIVEYIVKQTVGKLLEEWETGGLEGWKAGRMTTSQPSNLPSFQASAPPTFRILDPACGSGSFLIGAFQYLLDYHLHWYTVNQPEKHKKAVVWIPRAGQTQTSKARSAETFEVSSPPTGEWRLTIAEKKRILLNNIFGLDIDRQAVNVTQLNLLLKALEGETDQTLQLSLFQEQVLPQLSHNVKCGNSLIDDQFYASGQMTLFGDEELLRRVNAFDWQMEFPVVMKAGGFDAVIGNPPYIRSINLKESNPEEWDYYRSKYKTASFREWDIYLIFVEKALALLKKDGRLGFILPNKFLNSQVGESLREILSAGKFLEKLIHFEAFQIFPTATTYTCLLFLDKSGQDTAEIARYRGQMDKVKQRCPLPEEASELWAVSTVNTQELSSTPWEFTSDLIAKLKKWPGLGTIADIFKGTGTNADKVYLLENRGREGDLIRVYSAEKDEVFLLEPTYLKPTLRGRSISRYEISGDLLLIVPYEIADSGGKLVSEKVFKQKAPKTLEYLRKCKPRLDEREDGRFKGEGWYQYGRPQNLHRFEVPEKIILPDVANRGACCLDTKGLWLLDTAYAIVKKPGVGLDLRFILGVLNSPILTVFLKETGTALRGGYFRMKTAYLTPFPIRTIDFSNPAEVKQHDEMVRLVEQMLALHQKVATATNPADRQMYQRQIAATDRAIDRLVYQLYNLTEEEIRIVEGTGE